MIEHRRLAMAACLMLAAGLVPGCSAAPPAVSGEPAPESPQEALAQAMSEAHRAERHGDAAALARSLDIIDRSAARPARDWEGRDPVPGWRQRVPDRAPPLRGSPLGPGYRAGTLRAGHRDSFEQVFLSGKKASIALSSPGNAPLSLQVLDANGTPVCRTDRAASRSCRWVPLFTQRFRIEVRNGGKRKADYFLVVD